MRLILITFNLSTNYHRKRFSMRAQVNMAHFDHHGYNINSPPSEKQKNRQNLVEFQFIRKITP